MLKLIFVLLILISIGVAVFYGFKVLGGNLPEWGGDSSTSTDQLNATGLYTAFNTWRSNHVLPQLRTEDRLCSFAVRRAKELGDTTKPAKDFSQFLQKNALSATLPYDAAAELQGTAADPTETVRVWSEDEISRQILEDKQFTYTCVRCSKGMCSQLFVLPKAE